MRRPGDAPGSLPRGGRRVAFAGHRAPERATGAAADHRCGRRHPIADIARHDLRRPGARWRRSQLMPRRARRSRPRPLPEEPHHADDPGVEPEAPRGDDAARPHRARGPDPDRARRPAARTRRRGRRRPLDGRGRRPAARDRRLRRASLVQPHPTHRDTARVARGRARPGRGPDNHRPHHRRRVPFRPSARHPDLAADLPARPRSRPDHRAGRQQWLRVLPAADRAGRSARDLRGRDTHAAAHRSWRAHRRTGGRGSRAGRPRSRRVGRVTDDARDRR